MIGTYRFKIGDRVICTNPGEENCFNKVGTITKEGDIVCVEFDTYVDGHKGNTGKKGFCWYLTQEEIMYAPTEWDR